VHRSTHTLRAARELLGYKQVTGYYDRPADDRAEAQKAAAAAERDNTLSVDCPDCGELAGARCASLITGKRTNIVHAARVKAWEIATISKQNDPYSALNSAENGDS
jgi:hypothetical protein